MRKLLLTLAVSAGLFQAAAHGQGTSPKDLPSALQYLKSDKSSDRAFALSVMGLLGNDAVTASKQVVQSYFDPSPEVRRAAALALPNVNQALYGPVQTLTAANNPTNLNQYADQLKAIQTLSNLGQGGDGALPALLAFLPRMKPDDQAKLVAAVAKVGVNDPEARKALTNWALTNPNAAVREAAMKSLPKMTDARAEVGPFLTALKNEKNTKKRVELIGSLGQIGRGNAQVKTTLQGYLSDPSPEVRKAAKEALMKLN